MSTDTVCSTHVAEDDVTSQIPSDIYPSPVTSGDMESCIFTNTVCSTHVTVFDVTAVCINFTARVNLWLWIALGDMYSCVSTVAVCSTHAVMLRMK